MKIKTIRIYFILFITISLCSSIPLVSYALAPRSITIKIPRVKAVSTQNMRAPKRKIFTTATKETKNKATREGPSPEIEGIVDHLTDLLLFGRDETLGNEVYTTVENLRRIGAAHYAAQEDRKIYLCLMGIASRYSQEEHPEQRPLKSLMIKVYDILGIRGPEELYRSGSIETAGVYQEDHGFFIKDFNPRESSLLNEVIKQLERLKEIPEALIRSKRIYMDDNISYMQYIISQRIKLSELLEGFPRSRLLRVIAANFNFAKETKGSTYFDFSLFSSGNISNIHLTDPIIQQRLREMEKRLGEAIALLKLARKQNRLLVESKDRLPIPPELFPYSGELRNVVAEEYWDSFVWNPERSILNLLPSTSRKASRATARSS
jgi:hypothetical protein